MKLWSAIQRHVDFNLAVLVLLLFAVTVPRFTRLIPLHDAMQAF